MKIHIDGKEIEVKGEKTLLEVARENGIYIPSLCDHPGLEPFSGCRLCVVETKGRKGYRPSCSTYVEEGMDVRTDTPALKKVRRQILELILSEHPNACLICSEKSRCDDYKSTIRKVGEVTGCVLCSNNGRCELQDVVEAVGLNEVRFSSHYRDYEVRQDDPFFDRNYNLCILCGRCVRVCHEVRGASAISFVFRGSQAVVGTSLDRTLLDSGCQFCGACVDVCPTGAMVERAVKPERLPDETRNTICPLCSVGCELEVGLLRGRILYTRPDEKGKVNKGQACVRGRFGLRDLVHSESRIFKPLLRVRKKLEEVSWEEALEFAAENLKKYTGEEIALISSAQLFTEDIYALYRFGREVLETENIDSISALFPDYWEWGRENNLLSSISFKLEDISRADNIFILGANVTLSHPVVGLKVIKAVSEGAKLIVSEPRDIPLNLHSSLWLKLKPGTELYLILALSKILLAEEKKRGESFSRIDGFSLFMKTLDNYSVLKLSSMIGISEDKLRETAKTLSSGKNKVFIFGEGLTRHPWGKESLSALWNLSLLCGAKLCPLGLENNLRGEKEIRRYFSPLGMKFERIMEETLEGKIKALYLAGDFPLPGKNKPEFLIFQGSFMDGNALKADVVFPAATFAESEGTFINLEGRIQKVKPVISLQGEAKPDWWIISALAARIGDGKYRFKKAAEITERIKKEIPGFSRVSMASLDQGKEAFIREEHTVNTKFLPLDCSQKPQRKSEGLPFILLSEFSLDHYRGADLTREIKGLSMLRDSRWLWLNPEDAEALRLEQGSGVELLSPRFKVPCLVKYSDSLPRGVVTTFSLWRRASEMSTFSLRENIIPVKIRKKSQRKEKK